MYSLIATADVATLKEVIPANVVQDSVLLNLEQTALVSRPTDIIITSYFFTCLVLHNVKQEQ